MKNLLLIALLVLFVSCNLSSGNNSTIQHGLAKADTSRLSAKIKNYGLNSKSLEKLIGVWADTAGGNAAFEIDKKTFYYPDNGDNYNYKIIGDSIQVHYEGFLQSFAWQFKGNDTLLLKGADSISTFYRIKE